jgi:hypothetical protein
MYIHFGESWFKVNSPRDCARQVSLAVATNQVCLVGFCNQPGVTWKGIPSRYIIKVGQSSGIIGKGGQKISAQTRGRGGGGVPKGLKKIYYFT